MPTLKNRGPLLVDKVRGYFDRLPEWLRGQLTIRVEHQKVDALIDDLDPLAIDSELKQEVTDEKLRTNKYIGDGEPGSGNDLAELPISHPSEVVIPETGQVADQTETVSATEEHLVEGPPLYSGSSEQIGDVWVQKKVETRETFDDKSYQLQREDLIPKEFRALVPEKTEAHTVDGEAALPVLNPGELVKKEEQRKVGVKTVTTQSRDMSTPPVITGKKIDPQWNGAELDLEQKIVPAGTDISQVFGNTDISIKPIDGINALQETWRADAGFPTIMLRKYDPDLTAEIQEYLEVVEQGAPYVYGPTDIDHEDRQIDAVHSLRKTTRAPYLPAYVTYTTQTVTFPGILSYISFSLIALAAANRKEPQWTVGLRAPFSVPTLIQTNTYFTMNEPTMDALYTWAPTDVTFKGVSFSINLNNVLTDSWSNIGVTYSGDTYYGSLADRFSISATNPSATSYVSLIGTQQGFSSVIDRYKGLWVKKTSYFRLR